MASNDTKVKAKPTALPWSKLRAGAEVRIIEQMSHGQIIIPAGTVVKVTPISLGFVNLTLCSAIGNFKAGHVLYGVDVLSPNWRSDNFWGVPPEEPKGDGTILGKYYPAKTS